MLYLSLSANYTFAIEPKTNRRMRLIVYQNGENWFAAKRTSNS
ncbi:hypothetical protein ACFGVR_22775 [Mucilaginibacter sp. AW1-3]